MAQKVRSYVSNSVVCEALESRQLLSTVPSGYSESAVASGLNNPVAMEIAPDGRVFITEQAGTLRIVKNGALLATPALTLAVDNQGERGLLSVAFDPNFATNGHVYVYYTISTPQPHNRISRFTMTGDTVNPASETVLFELDNQTETYHMGGDLHFGNDGKLYFTSGENLNGANAQTLTNTLGKVLRINPDGTIPTDNPFYNQTTGKNKAIYAYGLRNPFTFDVQSTTGKIFINDVGQFSWEEIDQLAAGANYGWPNEEGVGSNAAFTQPIFAYAHGSGTTMGYAITGGAFYNPTQAEFPPDMIGKYFFADYVNGWIRVLDPATNTATVFATDAIAPVDLEVSNDGAMYYLSRSINGGTGALFKIRHIAAPQIAIQPQSQTVPPGSPVTFNVVATGTGALSYQWQRNGVDIPGATSASYTVNSVSAADQGAKFRVVVTDSVGNAVLANGATWVAGQNGTALGLDGVNDYAETNTDLSQWLGGTSTLAFWIKTTQQGTNVFYEAPGVTGVEQFGGDNDIMWGWLNATGQIGIHPGNDLGLSSNKPVNDGVWHSIALTRDAATGVMQVYIDGVFDKQVTSFIGLKSTPFSRIGSIDDTGGTPSYLGGSLDDVRIYNRVLTAAEIAAASLPTSGLQSQYLFNEGSGIVARNNVQPNGSTTSQEATLTVASGSLPTPTILTPLLGTTFAAGDTIVFSGSGLDTEDGNLPASALTWRIDLQHDTHSHPAMPNLTGVTGGSWVIPTVGETSDNIWYRVYLTVMDSSGQSVTTYRDVIPRKVDMTFASSLPGVTLTLDGASINSPSVIKGVIGIERTIGAPSTVTIAGTNYTFTGWSDGGAATHTISTPTANTTYTANYAASGVVYASDIAWSSATNSYGAVELDHSMGESGPTDGNPIKLRGTTYTKGLGVHAYSEITYNIAGAGYKTFISDVGVDDETGGNGSLIFQVWVDGVLNGASPIVTGTSAPITLTVDVTGASTIKLIVTDAGNGDWFDHGDWAGARFTLAPANNAPPVPTIVTPAINTKYSAGTVLNFSGTGTDAEDGTLPASKFTWSIEQVHTDHTHVMLPPTSGITGGTFAIPNNDETEVVSYRVILTVTDSAGQSVTVARDVLPNTATITLASNISGVGLLLDGAAAPASFVGVAGVLRTIAAPATVVSGGVNYSFAGWSDGGAAMHTITTPGVDTTFTAIYTPNAVPVPTIATPIVGAKYIAGQAITFTGDATDTEDGTLAASKFSWKVDFYKNGALVNTVYTVAGSKSGSFTPPTSGETSANVFYRISLTVTDSANQAVTVTRDVLPTTVTLNFASSPAGVALSLDGAAVTGGVSSVVGVQHTLSAPAAATIGGLGYTFTIWSDGGAATHTITTPAVNTNYTATYTTVPIVATPVYLSDLTPTGTPINGWGPYEKDKSNGELAAGDGKTLTLAGVTFAKGLGVHGTSDISYTLGGQYATFLSSIGLDDEVGSKGSATFVVYLDGVQAYSSGAMTGSTATKTVLLNVTGKQTLRLVVQAGADVQFDHADWAGARLFTPTGALPAGMSSSDIGSVGVAGSAGFVNGSYVVSGSGTDIAGTSDSFRFVYQQLSGNVQLTARVTSLGVTNTGSKAGVMLRSSLAANSIEAGMFLTANSGFASTRRTTTGGNTTTAASGTSAFPYWVRIVRSGSTVTTFRSADGVAWTQVSSNTVNLGTTIYVGLAVTSKLNTTLTTAVFDNVSITPLP